MQKDIPKAYEPKQYEDGIYEKWEQSGYFNPDNLELDEKAKSFVVSMPPPNVTGVLHLGHALENAIMDIAVRYNRMRGKRTLLVPGTDHAAVATQARVEKNLIKEGIINPRKDLGREELLKRVRKYAEESKATIIKQIKKMGTSCDWSRLAYTFDEERSAAVNEVFIRMHNDGLIYKGYRVINWSVKGQSTCSDDELVYIEKKTKLYTFKYAKDFPAAISTTRPETKLGDTAVAVNPKDKRYRDLVGKIFSVDVGAQEKLNIKIIADESVDPDYGTGALGVTPAHSQIDFEIAEKHKLDLIQVIDSDGRMTEKAGKNYQGLTVTEAREKFVGWLRANDLIEAEEEISHNVGTSDRFGDIVEVIPMEQWFIDVNKKIPGRNKSLKDLMRDAVAAGHNGNKDKKINIIPERFNNNYFHWIDNLRDWCISRQIWWGHRIPVWYCEKLEVRSKKSKLNEKCKKPIINIKDVKKCPGCGGTVKQDPDTLDTWFSSGLWTFSTLGWPQPTEDFKKYHPTTWMQMGYEILFFWMARMILMSTYALDDIPFYEVYIHGILRDKDGKKFSKSLGTGIDPIKVADKYGTDALRLSLILGISPGNDARFYEEKVEGARNLVNKLWNVSRYVILNTEEAKLPTGSLASKELTLADSWILSKLESLVNAVTEDLDNYRFSQAGERLREFTWSDFADWYLEASKFEKTSEKNAILRYCLEMILKLWHPFMPFVTEAIWSSYAEATEDKDEMGASESSESLTGSLQVRDSDGDEEMLIIEKWPVCAKASEGKPSKVSDGAFNSAEGDFGLIKGIITAIRNARAEYRIKPSIKVKAVVYARGNQELIVSQARLIKSLRTGVKELEVKERGEKLDNAIYVTVNGIEINLIVPDFDFKAERERIEKEIKEQAGRIKALEGKLANKAFIDKAPEKIVKQEQDKLALWRGELAKMEEQLKKLQ